MRAARAGRGQGERALAADALMERETGFEPATTCLEGRSSTGLSYPRVLQRSLYNIRRPRAHDVPAPHASRAVLTTSARGAGADATNVPVVAASRVVCPLVVTWASPGLIGKLQREQ